jgi:hypothetical protein
VTAAREVPFAQSWSSDAVLINVIYRRLGWRRCMRLDAPDALYKTEIWNKYSLYLSTWRLSVRQCQASVSIRNYCTSAGI